LFAVHKYFLGEVLPPHLSPFADEIRRVGDYVPPEETETQMDQGIDSEPEAG